MLQRPIERRQFTSVRYGEQLSDLGAVSSIGSVADSFDNALAETINCLHKTELIKPRKPWRSAEEVELATAEWID